MTNNTQDNELFQKFVNVLSEEWGIRRMDEGDLGGAGTMKQHADELEGFISNHFDKSYYNKSDPEKFFDTKVMRQ